jgi:hypothetical protein
MQAAPFRQGPPAQSSMLVSQLVPVKPGAHAQVYPVSPLSHEAPF